MFGRDFAASSWERQPTVIRNLRGQPLATPDEILNALVMLRRRTWRNGAPQRNLLRFFVENGQILCDASQYFPAESDAGFDAYVDRITTALEGRCFGLSGNAMQAGSPRLARDLRAFLRGAFDVVGMPSEEAEAVCFAGNYRLSPFGIHTDTAGVFSFVISGRKRYRVWPHEALANVPALRYGSIGWEQHASSSILLEGEPGDIIYWPSTYWHVGLAEPGELSIVLNVAMYLSAHPWSFVGRAIQRFTRARQRAAPLLTFERRREYPAALAAALAELGAAHGGELALEAKRQWLETTTSVALPSYDERLPRPVWHDETIVDVTADELVVEPHADWLIVATGGDSLVVRRSPAVEALLAGLRPGSYRLGTLAPADPEARDLIFQLATLGVVCASATG